MGTATRMLLTAILTAMCCLVLPWVVALTSSAARQAILDDGNRVWPLAALCAAILGYGVLLGFQGRQLDRWHRTGPAAATNVLVAGLSLVLGWAVPGPWVLAGPQVLVGTLAYLGFSAVMLSGSRRRTAAELEPQR
ncbi:hypothetical protein OK351_05835 [Glutamicibacter sp. MNS18]|uniref:hypothetical protein n=1 Tax=Glutamicibacter sp. MNS18 TaxID=2989817 RepID=UPI0022366864|nr:hypothetical protein [Glutamicibacter sp. MNS18]MCW4465022.1 hypothetical protein [Glutamicibacter sp. MNS18]